MYPEQGTSGPPDILDYDSYHPLPLALLAGASGSRIPEHLEQWSPTLGVQMFLDCNSQKPSPPPLLARISGS